MPSVPPGCKTIGPIYEYESVKNKFVELCKNEGKYMETKLKELIRGAVSAAFPDFVFPVEPVDKTPDTTEKQPEVDDA